jgi:hypothetical protein
MANATGLICTCCLSHAASLTDELVGPPKNASEEANAKAQEALSRRGKSGNGTKRVASPSHEQALHSSTRLCPYRVSALHSHQRPLSDGLSITLVFQTLPFHFLPAMSKTTFIALGSRAAIIACSA